LRFSIGKRISLPANAYQVMAAVVLLLLAESISSGKIFISLAWNEYQPETESQEVSLEKRYIR
jgi:hypothetical protein